MSRDGRSGRWVFEGCKKEIISAHRSAYLMSRVTDQKILLLPVWGIVVRDDLEAFVSEVVL